MGKYEGNENRSRSRSKTLTILLGISIILNCYIILNLGYLKESIMDDLYNNSIRLLEDELNEIKGSLYEIKQDLSWISKVNIVNRGTVGKAQFIEFTWQLKDLSIVSDVSFYCRKIGDKSFKQIPVTLQTQGSYSSEIEIIVEDEPIWYLSYITYDKDLKDSVNLYSPKNISYYLYEYYITLNHGNRIITSDVEQVNLSKYLQLYSIINTYVKFNNESKPFDIDFSFEEGRAIPKKIILEIYKGNDVNDEEVMMDKVKRFGTWKSDGSSFDKLVIRAEYENEYIFRNEIWHESKINF